MAFIILLVLLEGRDEVDDGTVLMPMGFGVKSLLGGGCMLVLLLLVGRIVAVCCEVLCCCADDEVCCSTRDFLPGFAMRGIDLLSDSGEWCVKYMLL